MNAFSKTALYAGLTDLPPRVARAVALANDVGFIQCCIPEQGRLLQVLARGRAGGVIGETGTGCGAGLAWMASAVGLETRLVSVEQDAGRAAACQALFADLPNVTVLQGDWRLIEPYGPFDLLVLEGGGGGKRADDPAADPARLLSPGGTLVLDDFVPPLEFWPEDVVGPDADGRSTTAARRHWLQHPALFATEVRVHPMVSVILATRKAPQAAEALASELATRRLPKARTTVAPDGSDVRVLLGLERGGMAQFELAAGETSTAVTHRTVEEIWLFLSGRGEMWRRQGVREEIVPLAAGVCLTIPLGTHFQFRSFGPEALAAVAVTLPPWPGEGEATPVAGPWRPTVPR